MADVSSTLQQALQDCLEYEEAASHLSALLQSYPPPFIFVHDPENPRLAASAVRFTLQNLASGSSELVQLKYACINAVACFSPRILFDTALNALAGWVPDWQSGAQNWLGPTGEGRRFNENFDAFMHGLQAIYADTAAMGRGSDVGKGKGRASDRACPTPRLVLMVERAERLRDNLPELLVPLTRLAEQVCYSSPGPHAWDSHRWLYQIQSRVDIITVFVSEVQWQDIRPPLRASPEPYYIDVPALSRQGNSSEHFLSRCRLLTPAFPTATHNLLSSCYPSPPEASTSQLVEPRVYDRALEPLYEHFIATLYGICSPFTHDPLELAYIAAARWPGFVQPILDAHKRHLEEEADPETGDELPPLTEDTRLRLTRLFTPSLTAALEALYPRLSSAAHWAHIHAPPPDLLTFPPGRAPDALLAQAAANARTGTHGGGAADEAGVAALPRTARFVLVAAFLASTNPARSDVRMFGRGPDERAKRRRRGGSAAGTPRRPKPGTTGTAVKVPQRLLGPTAFPLDRMLAILGVLLEENDVETRLVAPQYGLPGEYTEMEIARVALYANVSASADSDFVYC